MRQVLFVIAVVGAAFLGGAVVNGPGFRWAQERLLVYMGLQDGGEIASIDLPPAPGAAPEAKNEPTGPTVKEPEVAAAPTVANSDARRAEDEDEDEAHGERQALSQGVPAPKAEPRATEPFVETDARKGEPEPPAGGAPALLGALAGGLKPTAPPPGAADGPTKAPEPEPAAPPAPLDPSVAPAAAPSDSEPAPNDAPASDGADDWADLRRKLGEQGVTRYTIEGEPGGRVVFACLIPLAGKQAVSQRIEAEGADEFQAARAALRRITLWRAAQAGPAK